MILHYNIEIHFNYNINFKIINRLKEIERLIDEISKTGNDKVIGIVKENERKNVEEHDDLNMNQFTISELNQKVIDNDKKLQIMKN